MPSSVASVREFLETHLLRLSRTLLAGLLGITLIGAVLYDRAGWGDPVAGEATCLMQADSLLHDFDLTYTRADFDRFLLKWQGNPTDLELSSGSGGHRIAFDRPFTYALWLLPFLLLWPQHGFAVANALLLALAGLFAARILERQVGAAGALWVALLIFASVSFSYVFLATADLLRLSVTVVAFCLIASTHSRPKATAQSTPPPRSESGISRRWLAAGVLLAIVVASEPLAGVLLVLAACFAVPAGRAAAAARSALLIGFAASLVLQIGVQWYAGGGLHFLATTRFRFTPETGFPLVDFTAAEWTEMVRRLQALYWEEAVRFSWGIDLRLWIWDFLDLFAGRSIGLIPYFAPLVLIAASGSAAGFRRAILAAGGVWIAGILFLHPFNLYGGEGAIGNRLFLPIYGALWLVAGRRRRAGWAIPVVLALAVLFLWRLWSAPWSHPLAEGGGYHHVTSVASRILPYETSQRRIPAGQVAELGDLRVQPINDAVWADPRRDRLVIDGAAPAELLVISSMPPDLLRLDFTADAPAHLKLGGGRLAERILRPDGSVSFRVVPRWPVRRHPLWWTPKDQWLVCLRLELPEAGEKPLGFKLVGERI